MDDWDIDDLVSLFCTCMLGALFAMLYLEYV
jgi:hypothetical protein